jgi:2-C-methyl-D-erythritol 2,4-cyclodiphosphate synthase
MRSGLGFDIHKFAPDDDKVLILGGVEFPDAVGLVGHSDADAVCHAITDALLGAACLGDMGDHFPDTDPKWSGANSIDMLSAAVEMVRSVGMTVANVDCTVIAEAPKISPHKQAMMNKLSEVVGAPVSVKATRAEGLGTIGRVEGIACMAVALLAEGPNRD